jgi:nucleoside-diphosphate-sugar epimerase
MKVLLYGANGWIGSQVNNILLKGGHQVIVGNERHEKMLEQEIIATKPTHIMSFIGRTHGSITTVDSEGNETCKEYTTIDYLEQPGKLVENVRDNLFSPIVLALLAQKHNIHYTYMGTGCIFTYNDDELEHMSDKDDGAVWVDEHRSRRGLGAGEEGLGSGVYKFKEDDQPNFFGSSYSTVKGYTDRLMHLFSNVLNIRIRMPITADYNPRNFITKILKYKKICSVQNSMSVLPMLLPIMVNMAEKGRTGTVNLVNPGTISHNEILYLYKLYIDPTFTWSNFSIEEQQKVLAAGRSNNHLDTTTLEKDYNVMSIHDAITTVLTKMRD